MAFASNVTLVACALTAILLSSCGTTTPVEWQQVKSKPLTFHPAGFDAPPGDELPRGNWVSDEGRKVNFFVPEGGTAGHTASQLHRDAVSRVSPDSLPPATNRPRFGIGFGVGVGRWHW